MIWWFLGTVVTALASPSGPSSWTAGSVAMRCSGSAWHLYDLWDLETRSVRIPSGPAGEAEIFNHLRKGLPLLTLKVEEERARLAKVPGSYELGMPTGMTIPSGCEARLITRIRSQEEGIRVFSDEELISALSPRERALVFLRTEFSYAIASTEDPVGNRLFRGWIFERPETTSLREWFEIQRHFSLSPQIHGVSFQITTQDRITGDTFAYDDSSSPHGPPSFYEDVFFNSVRFVKISCPDGFSPTLASREEFVDRCFVDVSGVLPEGGIRGRDLFGVFRSVVVEGELEVWKRGLKSPRGRTTLEADVPWTGSKRWDARAIGLSQNRQSGFVTFRLRESLTVLDEIRIDSSSETDYVAEWGNPDQSASQARFHLRYSSERGIQDLTRATFGNVRVQAQSMGIKIDRQGLLSLEASNGSASGLSNLIGGRGSVPDELGFDFVRLVKREGKWEIASLECRECAVSFLDSPWIKSYFGSWSMKRYSGSDDWIGFDPRPEIERSPMDWEGIFSYEKGRMFLEGVTGKNCAKGTLRPRGPDGGVFLFGKKYRFQEDEIWWIGCHIEDASEKSSAGYRLTLKEKDIEFPGTRLPFKPGSVSLWVDLKAGENRIEITGDLRKSVWIRDLEGRRVRVSPQRGIPATFVYTENDGLRVCDGSQCR